MLLTLMENYIDARGGKEIGFSLLQRRSGVSTSSLRRILQSEQQPNFANAVKILSIVEPQRAKARLVLQKMFPDVMESIGSIFSEGVLEKAMAGLHLELLQKHIVNTPHCQIIHLCANAEGVTESEIREEYGTAGIEAIKDLREDELIFESQCRLRLVSSNFSLSDVGVAKQVSVTLMNSFDLRNIGTDRAILGQVSEAVSDEGLKEIQKAARDYLKRIGSIRDDPYYRGRNVFFSLIATNTLGSVKGDAHA